MRAAQSTALNRFIKATSKVEVDPNAIENLSVNRADFLHALENDIKPVSFHFIIMIILLRVPFFSPNLRFFKIGYNFYIFFFTTVILVGSRFSNKPQKWV